MAKEDERVNFEKIKNGYIVNHSWSEKKQGHHEFVSEKEYFKTANETSNKLTEINKKIINKL